MKIFYNCEMFRENYNAVLDPYDCVFYKLAIARFDEAPRSLDVRYRPKSQPSNGKRNFHVENADVAA